MGMPIMIPHDLPPLPRPEPGRRWINSSTSRRGWSRISRYIKCPRYYAFNLEKSLKDAAARSDAAQREADGLEALPLDPSDEKRGTGKGSLGHEMQSHYWARLGACDNPVFVGMNEGTIRIDDPDELYEPEDAAFMMAESVGTMHFLNDMRRTFRSWQADCSPAIFGEVVAIEVEMTLVLGYLNGQYGLWLQEEPWFEGAQLSGRMVAPVGIESCPPDMINPIPLDAVGHPEHGQLITLTRRIDLIMRQGNQLKFWDHKHIHPNYMNTQTSCRRYAVDGGFAAMVAIGVQAGEFNREDGMMIHNIARMEAPYSRPTRVETGAVICGARVLNDLPALVERNEHAMARDYLAAGANKTFDPFRYEGRHHEASACVGHYGNNDECEHMSRCTF